MASGDEKDRGNLVARSVAPEDSRRHFLKTVGIGGIGVGLAAVVAAPAAAYVTYPLGHATVTGANGFVPVGKSTSFKEGQPLKVDVFADKRDAWNRILQVKVGSVWIIRKGGKLRAFSSVCPHLGCAFDYEPEVKEFKCPCHNAFYTIDGQVAGGPAPRPMDELELEEKDGKVAVHYQRFRTGTATKEVV
ncbi:MAG TPA: Rieske (2Fe-2S) protein [Polyangiaceae bacterium]|jgi:Rieske Fe-S protein|nr:Rieske (2Fe-2S) protein [Polyangiaceae bacterium]